MSEQPSESVIRKIQKLLAHSKGKGTTEEEASTAMDMATELLAKYNLDMAIIDKAVVEGGTVTAPEKREKTKIDRSAMYKWQQELCRRIASANFCWYWAQEVLEPKGKPDQYGYQPKRKVKRHVILGREANVVAVQMMYEYLVETLEDILPYPHVERLSRSAVSWREGAAERLAERVEAKAYAMRNPDTNATAAVKETGVMLRSVVQSEYAANYDSLYGVDAYAKAIARQEAYKLEQANKPKVELTAAELAKQEKANQKYWKQQERQRQQELDRRDHDAYRAGRVVGGEISLQDRLEGK